MAAPRNENIKEVILEKTAALMEENGIDSISLANIADACGISKGTLYYHYRTKEDIFFDILDRYLNQQEELLLLWMNDQSKDTSVQRVLKYVLERNVHEVVPRTQMYYAACFGNEPLRQNILDRYHKFQTIISEKVLERDDVSKEQADYIAWLSLLLSDGMVLQKELHNAAFDEKKFIADTENYFQHLFRLS